MTVRWRQVGTLVRRGSLNPTCTVPLSTSAYQNVQDALFRRQHRLVTAGDEAV